jgi:7-cyano-7-deazaguanine synthase
MSSPSPAGAATVAVVSGGLDSTVMAYALRAEGHRLHAISFDYGQRHRRELDCARALAADLGAPWELVDLRAAGITRLLAGSALTDESIEVPEGHYADESMRATVVPNRNAVMLALACALAGSIGAGAVAFAVHAGDHPIYPDCRPEFVEAFEAMERVAMQGMAELRILAPFVQLTKQDIVRLGAEHGVPFERTWSCYKGGELHCGRCGTCHERREAFALAGVADPTMYAP